MAFYGIGIKADIIDLGINILKAKNLFKKPIIPRIKYIKETNKNDGIKFPLIILEFISFGLIILKNKPELILAAKAPFVLPFISNNPDRIINVPGINNILV